MAQAATTAAAAAAAEGGAGASAGEGFHGIDAESEAILERAIYTPRNILLTGGAGFIGSHVVLRLVRNANYKVVNLDKLDYCSCLENLSELEGLSNYKFIKGNICSPDLVSYVLQSEEIDTIMHFAAQTHVDNSFGNSFEFTKNNILGTHVLLESARRFGIKRFIHVSTDEVYGEAEQDQDPMFEHHVLEPTNPYAATKAGAEFLAKSYFRSFDVPVIITRGNNVYGPHQYPEKLIPKFINQLMRGRKLTLHGEGQHQRNYLFVEDVARAFDYVLHIGEPGNVYNVGGTNEVSNKNVAYSLIKIMNGIDEEEKQDELIQYTEDRPFNDQRYAINGAKLNELGWTEQVSWEDGLARTVAWYREHSDRFTDIENALVAHPRRLGSSAEEVV